MRRCKADAAQTRIAILNAAEELFSEFGMEAATLERIASKARVTRGAFYWYFKDKMDVLAALRERCRLPQEALIEAATKNGHGDPLGFLEQMGIEVLEAFETDMHFQRFCTIMASHVPSEAGVLFKQVNDDMFAMILRLTTIARTNGELAHGISPEDAAVSFMAQVNGLTSEWLRSRKAFPLRESGARLIRLHLRMLRGTPR